MEIVASRRTPRPDTALVVQSWRTYTVLQTTDQPPPLAGTFSMTRRCSMAAKSWLHIENDWLTPNNNISRVSQQQQLRIMCPTHNTHEDDDSSSGCKQTSSRDQQLRQINHISMAFSAASRAHVGTRRVRGLCTADVITTAPSRDILDLAMSFYDGIRMNEVMSLKPVRIVYIMLSH